MREKLISIVTVVLNNRDKMKIFLDRYENLNSRNAIELVVIDGGSDDGTLDLLKDNGNLINVLHSGPDGGIYDAMNRGIQLASGRYIALINSDDWVIPDNFDAAVELISDATEDIVAFGARMVRNGRFIFNRWPRQLDASLFVRTIPFSHNAIFVAKSCYRKVGLYRTDLQIVSDLEFYYRAFRNKSTVRTVDKLIINSELTGLSGRNPFVLREENVSILNEYFPFFTRPQAETLVDFRSALANADQSFNLASLIPLIEVSTKNEFDLADVLKQAIDVNPTNLIGKNYDALLRHLPRFAGRILRSSLSEISDCDPDLITIGIPAYNCADTIERAIRSALAQTWEKTEVLVYDDNSTDQTVNLVRNIGSDKVRLIKGSRNRGVAYARNQLALHARSDFIMFCDDDDVSHPARAEKCFERIKAVAHECGHNNIICYSTRDVVTLSGQSFRVVAAGSDFAVSGRDIDRIVLANLARVAGAKGLLDGLEISVPRALGCGVGMYPTKLLRQIGFHETFHRLEDLEFCIAAADQCVVVGIDEPLYTQYMTKGEEKSQDRTATFSALLLALHCQRFNQFGLSVDEIGQRYISMADARTRPALQALLERAGRSVEYDPAYLKVATLCVWDYGGAGIGSQRRVEAQRKAGIDNHIFCIFKRSNRKYVHELPVAAQFNGKPVLSSWRDVAVVTADEQQGLRARELFSKVGSVVDFHELSSVLSQFDVIHLHWVAGLLDYQHRDFLSTKPVAWTLADMNAFTGGCHYSEGCTGYRNECKSCPLLEEGSTIAHEAWRIKREAYATIKDLHVICPSQWLADCARESSLLGGRPIHVVPNAIPNDKFQPTNRMLARAKLGLPLDRKLVLFGAASLTNKRKGGDILAESIQHLRAMGMTENVEGVFFGANSLDLGIKTHNMGQISDEAKMSLIYAAADVFAFPSREDNAPLTVVESMLSGTPVVGFPVGNVPELVIHKDTGYIARYCDAKDFAHGLSWALLDVNSTSALARRMRVSLDARNHNDPATAVVRHLEIYSEMLKNTERYHDVVAIRHDLQAANPESGLATVASGDRQQTLAI